MSAAWRRFAVTRLALAQRRALCDELADRGIDATAVIVADDENLDLAMEFGFAPLEQSNDELGRKFNDGIEFALDVLEADVVVHVGSDDWIHPRVFDRLPSAELQLELPTPDRPAIVGRPAPEMVVCRSIAFVDLVGARMRLCRSDRRYGVIPWILPRVAFSRCGGRPIKENAERGIDGSLVRGLRLRPNVVVHDAGPVATVDWKTDTNLNGFEEITSALGYGSGYVEPWALLEQEYGPELVALAKETAESFA